jgi:Uma2 family endonuclease
MATVFHRLTYEDLQYTPDDGKRYELIDGEVFVSAMPRVKHQRVTQNIYRFLYRAEEAGFGAAFGVGVDTVFDQYNVTVPDCLFISHDRLDIITEANVSGAPDLIVEVLSPSTQHRDKGLKLQLYEHAGTRYYWIVDVNELVLYPYERGEPNFRALPPLYPGEILSCPLFPGISIDVAELFS